MTTEHVSRCEGCNGPATSVAKLRARPWMVYGCAPGGCGADVVISNDKARRVGRFFSRAYRGDGQILDVTATSSDPERREEVLMPDEARRPTRVLTHTTYEAWCDQCGRIVRETVERSEVVRSAELHDREHQAKGAASSARQAGIGDAPPFGSQHG